MYIMVFVLFLYLYADIVVNEGASAAQVIDSDGYISVTAEGASPAGGDIDEAQKKKIATETAYYAALQKLTEYIAGVEISGGVRVKNFQYMEGTIIEAISAELKGIEPVSCAVERLKDGSYSARVTIRIPAEEQNKIVGRITKRMGMAESELSGSDYDTFSGYSPAPSQNHGERYSGLIVDLRMLADRGSLPMLPILKTSFGRVLFHPSFVAIEHLLKHQSVGYAGSMAEALTSIQRIGKHPLIMRPVAVRENLQYEIIISEADAAKIVELDAGSDIFAMGRIVLVF